MLNSCLLEYCTVLLAFLLALYSTSVTVEASHVLGLLSDQDRFKSFSVQYSDASCCNHPTSSLNGVAKSSSSSAAGSERAIAS